MERREKGQVETVYSRFDSHSLYTVARDAGYHGKAAWSHGGLENFIQFISGYHPDSEKVKNVKEWVAEGCAYQRWMDFLNGEPDSKEYGFLIALPQVDTETM